MTGSTAGPRSRGLRGLLLLLGVVSIVTLVFAGTAFAVPPSNIGQALLLVKLSWTSTALPRPSCIRSPMTMKMDPGISTRR
jgi:hypothetical protein